MAVTGRCDSKHKINLSDKAVPNDVLEQIEKGCSLETLESIVGEFPICRYQTQITIHGHFPDISTRRIGGRYVNLVRNQNGSVGVRWTAIDTEKRTRLYQACAIGTAWHMAETSSSHLLYRMDHVTKENFEEVKSEMLAIEKRIDKSLFFGDVSLRKVDVWGFVYLVLVVNVAAFYEKDFWPLAEQISGKSRAEIEGVLAAEEAKRRQEEADWERECAEARERYAKAEAELKAANEQWIADNPAPFPKHEGYALKVGDVFCRPYAEKHGVSRGRYQRWCFYKVGKAFGRLIAVECDADGNTLKRGGREIRWPIGDYRVKVA